MGILLSFEGIDGSGKTTQIEKSADWLRAEHYDVLVCREPGGTELGEAIRAILLDPRWKEMSPRAEYLLYSASRAQLIEERVKPHLLKPRAVVMLDRYMDSSTAYQGGGRELGPDLIQAIHPFVTGGLLPDLTLYLDVDWETSLARRRDTPTDRLEQNEHVFFDRVRDAYLRLSQRFPERVVRVDARGEVEDVFRTLQAILSKRVSRTG
jgi:dTMP kinase